MLSGSRILAIAHEKLNVDAVCTSLLKLQKYRFLSISLVQILSQCLSINIEVMNICGDELRRGLVPISERSIGNIFESDVLDPIHQNRQM